MFLKCFMRFSPCLLIVLIPLNSYTSIDDYFQHDVSATSSNYGNTGLLELPNARFLKPGSLRFTFSSSYPNEYTAFTATPFEWMEATYRYVEIKNKNYGPAAYSGNQTWKDKGFDLKIRLLKEDFILPSIAIGLRDLAGTGSFAAEYLVLTKSIKNFDFTAGVGWGMLGLANNIKNPLIFLDDRFIDRGLKGSQVGGDFRYNRWFRGDSSLLGGIEYDLKKLGLRFKLEYDTSNPDIIPFPRLPIEVKSRFNIGVNYFLSNNLTIGAAFERGSQFRLSFVLEGNFIKDTIRKPSPKNVVNLNTLQTKAFKKNPDIFYRSLNKSLRDESIYIQGATLGEESIEVAVASTKYMSFPRLAGRTARIASALSPTSVNEVNIHIMNGDLEVSNVSIQKPDLDKATKLLIGEIELLTKTKLNSNSDQPLYKTSDFKPSVSFPEFSWSMSPALKHQIGGPEGFYLGQLFWRTDTTIKFRRGLSLYTSFGLDIYNNFNELNNPSYSSIPHVRSDIQDYLKEGKSNLARMQLEYVFSPKQDWFVRADIGLLEEMFGGIGGEILYRPFNKRISFGLTAHRVRQRDYDQRFSFREYKTTTGHVGIYYDFPKDISAQVLVGKYLAGDKGASLDLSRRFKTGFRLGIFATKTNLSAEEFGEGSFDKGFYFSIPTALFYTDYRRGNITFGLHPLTKDGGAILNHHHSLHGILGDTNKNAFLRDWKDLLN